MSAIDIVLAVIALVAVGAAVVCALQLKGLRAELRERGDSGAEMLAALEQAIAREFSQAGDRMDDLRRETAQQLGANREGIEHRLDKVRETVDAQLGAIRKDNNVQLDQMRATVDEKLSRTLNDRLSASFKQVSDQLEAVYKGLGDMQSIATGVGYLKPPSPAPRSAFSLPSSCRWTRAIPCCCRSTPNSRATRTSICSTRKSRAMLRLWPPRARRSMRW